MKSEKLKKRRVGAVRPLKVPRRSTAERLRDVATLALPLASVTLWALALPQVDVGRINDLGLVSVLPASLLLALALLTLSFCLALQRRKLQAPVLLLHLVLLIVMVYGITTLVEQAPRFAIVYRHEGYTEFIMRTGTVDPNVDSYFNWPGFFLLSAFLNRVAGYQNILPYATWAPVYYNLMYLGPMYVLFTTATTEKRIVWLALFLFCVTNWIAQDYYSPQGFNFFLYLVILAILLKWFGNPSAPRRPVRRWRRLGHLAPLLVWLEAWLTAPDPLLTPSQPRQRRFLLACVLLIFVFMVVSHPLTPFFMIASVGALVICGRITPRWLPLAMLAILLVWFATFAQAYVIDFGSQLLSAIGQIGGDVSANVTSRVAVGSPGHTFISDMRLFMTFFVWALAGLGALRRLRKGFRVGSMVLLAAVPFPILFLQDYGGEMLLRIYLFTLPPMVFFAASLFFRSPAVAATGSAWPTFSGQTERSIFGRLKALLTSIRNRVTRFKGRLWHMPDRHKAWWRQALIAGLCLFLLGGFLFTRYGNEREDYMTNAEVAGVQHLYAIAPPGSLLMAPIDGTPWEYKDYESYDLEVLYDDYPTLVTGANVGAIERFIGNVQAPRNYLIITRSQRATAELLGYPPGMLDQLEGALLRSRKFVMIFHNGDVQILQYVPGKQGG